MSSLESNILRVLDMLVPKIILRRQGLSRPIILGIAGLQGSGKSTWASQIVKLLSSSYELQAITVSLDDLYKTHDDLIALRGKDPQNKLYRTRGQPGTHDEQLASQFFQDLEAWVGEDELKIPSFDKSRFGGEGDRAPILEWPVVQGKVDVVVFEGWCVGFRALSDSDVELKHQAAQKSREPEGNESINTLAEHQLSHLKELNQNLQRYNNAFMGPQHFDFMIHIDTNDLRNVYRWRLQQEHALIKAKGSGMTDEQVLAFVRGYMPGYELFLDGLREGFFGAKSERQVRVILDIERRAKNIEVI
ncbi:P-loop containing nucleoside triphosphate hydrolase protein [Lojkania enalia]|uniref:P-loop containing nucleoside triphosphate hydrolase protein n=1 Tax=Lojkania enalia TaxID=147567 RepID=A0A9P4K547_9PLEO|nr:P-loop containing nucleoside triphosphate hydrolase protein [Didymosphaeria enalia]